MATEFFNDGEHRCVRFDDLAGSGENEVQANQYLIIDGKQGMLLDPGGNKSFSGLVSEMSTYLPPQKLEYIILSHQDPDVGSGLNGYLLITDALICFPSLWQRFIPAFCTKSLATDRVLSVPDVGMRLELGEAEIVLVPAHFLHSAGNLNVYDVASKTLFTGDLGASLLPPDNQYEVVQDFEAHVQYMEGFHQRYMPSAKICRQWAAMVWRMDIERIAPQHGAMFEGQTMVKRFIDWVAHIRGGVELLLAKQIYQLP
ncbi:MAG: MBL fold metallo-hydrolase [Chloroflexota bacterium]|nr:MBL fold metallo-hydrolase [Chloroflexota bacterium]